MGFDVIPAIDIRDGRCVRLAQGDFERETVWADDPSDTARAWSDAGARVLHVVDLDGAASGEPRSLGALGSIRAATAAMIQYGGGLRTDEAVEAAFAAGADRVVLGTALVIRPGWVGELCSRYGDRIVVGIDARGGRVATGGWLDTTELDVATVVDRANGLGVRRALFTDIERDGMLSGPNLVALRGVVQLARFEVIASGGVASQDDIEAVRVAGAGGVILGQALYTGRIDLRDAVLRHAH